MPLRILVASTALLISPCLAFSQSPPSSAAEPASDYVVTASRSPQAARDSARPVTVITAEDIRQTGAGSLSELLRTLGGVEMSSNGGLGQLSSVFIRGANSDHTVVLLDGVRIGSATSGTAPLEALPLALIERIEILPGPSSSLYGSDAIGGVIQIFTRSAERSPGAMAALTAGSLGLRQFAASYAARLGSGTDLALGVNSLRTAGLNVTTADNLYNYNPDRDGVRNNSFSARLSQQLSPDHSVGGQILRSRSVVHYDDGPDSPTDSNTRSDTLTESLALFWKGRLSADLRSELQLGRSRDESTDYTSFPGYFKTRQDQLSWLNHLALAGGEATVGLEWLKQALDSDTAYDRTERSIRSGLLGWRGQFGAQTVQADFRQDRNSQFGQHGTGQLAWAWRVDPAARLRASWGTAFHAPGFNWLYYPGFGNPALQPERSRSIEAGADLSLAGVELGATYFDSRIRDLIDAAPPDYQPVNIARATIRGLSFSGAGQLGAGTRAKLNLSFQDPQNADTGERLRRRSRVFGGLHLSQQFGAAQFGSDLSWVGRRYDSADQSPDSVMGAYGLVAVFAGWALSPDWRLEARVDNLGDKRYVTAIGYRMPGRTGQMTLRWTPGL